MSGTVYFYCQRLTIVFTRAATVRSAFDARENDAPAGTADPSFAHAHQQNAPQRLSKRRAVQV
jgi:hypothetical protein